MTMDEAVKKNTESESPRSRRRRNRESVVRAQETSSEGKDRPTPSRREEASKGNFLTRAFRKIVDYFSSTRAELQKVAWPTREDVLRLGGIVLAVTAVFSVALGLLDFFYGEMFRRGFNDPIIFIVFAVVLAAVFAGVVLYTKRHSSL